MISRIAHRYGQALFLEAAERGELDRVRKDAAMVEQVFAQEALLNQLFASPVVAAERKLTVITEVFGASVAPLTLNLMKLMNAKNRDAEIRGTLAAFTELYNERKGIVRVLVSSAVELDAAQRAAIEQRVREYTGKESVEAEFRIDADLIGGFTVRLGSTLLDGSLRRQIDRLRTHLASGAESNIGSNGRSAA